MASQPGVQSTDRYTLPEYLEHERTADFKSEYLGGRIYAMAGASPEHSAITFNLSGEIAAKLEATPCRGFSSDMKVRADPAGLYTYPDVTIVCGEPLYHDEKRDILINPSLIMEVLSPSTEAYDRGLKFQLYREIESLRDYILIAQDQPRIEHYVRQSHAEWLLSEVRGLEATLHIRSLEVTLALARIYREITFPPEPPRLVGKQEP